MEYIYALDPDNTGKYEAKPLLGKKQKREILAQTEQAVQINPNDALACIRKGNVLLSLSQLQEALILYNRALWLDPLHPTAFSGRGFTLWRQEQFEEAHTVFERTIQLAPQLVWGHIGLCRVLTSLKQYKEALAIIERILQLDVSNAEAYLCKASIYVLMAREASFGAGRYREDALAAYNRAIRLDPYYSDLHLQKAIFNYQIKRDSEALVAIDRYIQLEPDADGKGLGYELKYTMFKQNGRVREAEQVLQAALKDGVFFLPSK